MSSPRIKTAFLSSSSAGCGPETDFWPLRCGVGSGTRILQAIPSHHLFPLWPLGWYVGEPPWTRGWPQDHSCLDLQGWLQQNRYTQLSFMWKKQISIMFKPLQFSCIWCDSLYHTNSKWQTLWRLWMGFVMSFWKNKKNTADS